jgi:hypothetical protein
MSFHFNPKLVTDGLIWAMDIANPASFTPPYGGSGNNINDLTIYNNNFTLISSSAERPYTYSPNNLGSMDFYNDQIGSPTLGSHAQLNSVINTGNNFSVFFWVKPYSGSIASPSFGRNTIMTNAYVRGNSPSTKCGWFFLTFISFTTGNPPVTVVNGFSFAIGQDRSVISCASSLDMNNWNYIGVTVANAGATKKAYKNGIEISPSQNYNQTPTTIRYDGFLTSSLAKRLGGGPNEINLPDRFSGSLAAGHIYNRVLTPQEVGQNYNAYKIRFGLTQ